MHRANLIFKRLYRSLIICISLKVALTTAVRPAMAQKEIPLGAPSTAAATSDAPPTKTKAGEESDVQVGATQGAASSADLASKQLTPRQIYLKTLDAVGFVATDSATGTAWVWDVERRLMVTNDHVVEGAKEIIVYFPIHENGKLQVEPEYYREHAKPVKATVIDSERESDLAIIQLESIPENAISLELAESSADPGERVHAIGGRPYGSQGLWKYSTGFVSQVASADISQTGTKIMALQSNIDINSGNSGGPIVNDHGKVVAVAQSIIRDAQSVSYGVDVSSIRGYLHKACPLVDSASPEAKVELANRHRRRGRLDAAMKQLNEALKKDSSSVGGHTTRGWTFLELGDFATAVADFDSALELDGTDLEALRGRSLAHRALTEYDKAFADISRAIAQDATRADFYNARAIIQESRQKFDQALSDYQRALNLDGSNSLFLANRADLYIKLEKYQLAIDDLKSALGISPAAAQLHYLMGQVHYRLKDYQAAEPYFVRAVEIEGSNVRFVAEWGDNAQALGNHDQGVRLWSRVIELQASYAYAYFSRAWSLRRLKKLEAALADLNRAIELSGSDSQASFYQERALVYQDLGKADQAAQDFAHASRIDPKTYGEKSSAQTENEGTSLVGRWYVDQMVDEDRFEMTQEYRSDGTYDAVMNFTSGGETNTTQEQGKYEVGDGVIHFNTNLGDYDQKFKFEKGLFWIYFENSDYWFGSVRR